VTYKQLSVRPVVVLQNNVGNTYSPCVSVVPLSSNIIKARMNIHVVLKESDGVIKSLFIMTEQIQTLDKTDLIKKLNLIIENAIQRVNYVVTLQLGLLDMINVNVA